MYCEKCGHLLADEDRFCIKCGSSTSQVSSPDATAKPEAQLGGRNALKVANNSVVSVTASNSNRPNASSNATIKAGALIGIVLGGITGFLLRPSGFLIGQLPFGTVITRGSMLKGLDQLMVPLAEQSFNYLITGMVLGAVMGVVIGLFIRKSKV